MVDITSGNIFIDGQSIFGIPKKLLRSKLSIIPQQPFLFHGTIRENLDPLEQKSDAQIWDAIRKCRLEEAVQRSGGLEAKVSEKGSDFSAGQKQLFCLTRAILTDSKVNY
jgi:ABC-type multidrug transport system fused ATPase/permease subunit